MSGGDVTVAALRAEHYVLHLQSVGKYDRQLSDLAFGA